MKCTYELQYLYSTNRDTHDKHTFSGFKNQNLKRFQNII